MSIDQADQLTRIAVLVAATKASIMIKERNGEHVTTQR